MTHEVNVLALFKGPDKFIFVYDDDSRGELFDHIRDQAADPGSPVNWFDAAVLTDRARQQTEGTEPADTPRL